LPGHSLISTKEVGLVLTSLTEDWESRTNQQSCHVFSGTRSVLNNFSKYNINQIKALNVIEDNSFIET
jgi:hypothetical protein